MVIRNITFYTFSNYINIFLSFVQGFLLVKMLSLQQMGEFSQFKIILNYLLLFNFGLTNSFLILLPKVSDKEREIYKNKIFTINSLIFFVVSLCLLILVLFLRKEIFLFLFLTLFFYSAKEIPLYYLKSIGDFSKYSINLVLSQIILLVLTIVLTYSFGLNGAYISFIFYSLISFAVGVIFTKGIRFETFSFDNFLFFFRKGFSIYFVGFLNQIISSFERLFLSFILIKETFAIYSTAVFFISFVQMLPVSIVQYFLPDFVKNINKYSYRRLNFLFITISVLTFFFITLSYVFLKIVTKKFLTNYIESVNIFLILSITIFFDIFFYIMFNKLLSIEKLKYYNYLQIVGSFLTLSGVLIFYIFEKKIDIVNFSYYFLTLKTFYFFIGIFFTNFILKVKVLNLLSLATVLVFSLLIFSFEKLYLNLLIGIIIFICFIFVFKGKKLVLWMRKNLN
ncbi:MAG: oligosaccharide flippase family protein [candidate division WOR-3 bacterium]